MKRETFIGSGEFLVNTEKAEERIRQDLSKLRKETAMRLMTAVKNPLLDFLTGLAVFAIPGLIWFFVWWIFMHWFDGVDSFMCTMMSTLVAFAVGMVGRNVRNGELFK